MQRIIHFLPLDAALRVEASTSDGEVPGVRHLTVASTPVLLRRACGQNNNEESGRPTGRNDVLHRSLLEVSFKFNYFCTDITATSVSTSVQLQCRFSAVRRRCDHITKGGL